MPSLREVLGDKPSLGRHYNYLLRHKDKQCRTYFKLEPPVDEPSQRTSQVSHHVRRLTSCAQQDPQRLLGDSTELRMPPSGYAYGISASADSTPLLQSQQCDKGAHYYN
ncbi:hypothetical protein WJX77_009832 [Trebouxia sp. C0004]